MGSVVIRLRVLPKDANVEFPDLVESVKRELPQDARVLTAQEDPIAFGIVAAVLDIKAEEREGAIDTLERSIRSSSLVGELQVLGVSRASGRMK